MQNVLNICCAMLIAISLAVFPQVASAEGHNSQATLGSRGREVRVVECPQGEILVGLAGRTGAAIDQIQIVCAQLLANGGLGGAHLFGDRYGGFGGGEVEPIYCGGGRIAGAGVALDSTNTWVAETRLSCVDSNGRLAKTLHIGGGSNMRTDCTNVIISFCSDRVGAKAEYSCPDEYFTGIRVRFDTGVRGLGYLCDRRSPPIAATPAPAIKPVHRIGTARTTQPTAAPPQPADRAALRTVIVKLDVDLYAAPGGNGRAIGQLSAGTSNVELVQACQDNWCHVRWPGNEGWVYSGTDYNSLGR